MRSTLSRTLSADANADVEFRLTRTSGDASLTYATHPRKTNQRKNSDEQKNIRRNLSRTLSADGLSQIHLIRTSGDAWLSSATHLCKIKQTNKKKQRPKKKNPQNPLEDPER